MASKSQGAGTDMFCPGFQDHSQHSVFWSLFPTDHHQISTPVDSSLSLSFSTIPHSTIGAPQSTGFGMTSLQTNFLERPFLAMSSSFQQGRCL